MCLDRFQRTIVELSDQMLDIAQCRMSRKRLCDNWLSVAKTYLDNPSLGEIDAQNIDLEILSVYYPDTRKLLAYHYGDYEMRIYCSASVVISNILRRSYLSIHGHSKVPSAVSRSRTDHIFAIVGPPLVFTQSTLPMHLRFGHLSRHHPFVS